MKKFRIIRKDSGLQSGSREVSLAEALKYPVYNTIQGEFVSHEALKLSNLVYNVRFKKELISRKFELKGRQKISG